MKRKIVNDVFFFFLHGLLGLGVGLSEASAGVGPEVEGDAVVGIRVVGLRVEGDAVVGIRVVGLRVEGDAVVGIRVVGLRVEGDAVVGRRVVGDAEGVAVVGNLVGSGVEEHTQNSESKNLSII